MDHAEKIEAAIADLEKLPQFNVGFTAGYALGLIAAFQSCGEITWEQYESYRSRIEEIHKRWIAVCLRSRRENCVLLDDCAEEPAPAAATASSNS